MQLRLHACIPQVARATPPNDAEPAIAYFLVVKSVSSSDWPASVPAQVQEVLDLLPQAHLSPVTVFSSPARLQVQAPAARWPQEQVAPATLFSVDALSQVQCIAFCLPHEQVASLAQTQLWPSRLQQVAGTVPTGADMTTVGAGGTGRCEVGGWVLCL